MPARTSPTLLPHPLALCCHYPVSKRRSASIAVTGTLRVKPLSTMLIVYPTYNRYYRLTADNLRVQLELSSDFTYPTPSSLHSVTVGPVVHFTALDGHSAE